MGNHSDDTIAKTQRLLALSQETLKRIRANLKKDAIFNANAAKFLHEARQGLGINSIRFSVPTESGQSESTHFDEELRTAEAGSETS